MDKDVEMKRIPALAGKIHNLLVDEKERGQLHNYECLCALELVRTTWADAYKASFFEKNKEQLEQADLTSKKSIAA